MNLKLVLLAFSIISLFLSNVIAQPNFEKHTITDTLLLAKKFYPVDIDLDGVLDIVAVASNRATDSANVIWYKNDGHENFTAYEIADTFLTARAVWVSDIVNDGYPDILVGGEGRRPLTLYVNDGSPIDGGWIAKYIGVADCTIYSITTVDFDNDGNNDIVATYANLDNDTGGDAVRWYQNNGDTTFSTNILVTNYEAAGGVCINDFDLNGYWDIVTSAFGEYPPLVGTNDDLSWWQNDGSQNFSQKSLNIPTNFQNPINVCSADMNDDGFPDILSAAYFGGFTGNYATSGSLSWWENDKNGGFGEMQSLITDFTYARSIFGTDIDGDGDVDVLGAADEDNTILWLENDGSLNFTSHIITDAFSYAYYASAVDLDGDGDTDVLGSAQNAYEIAWWENDLDDNQVIADGRYEFWNGNVWINFNNSDQNLVTVFYNAGKTPNRNALGTGIDHIAERGYYTITTEKSGYDAGIDFHYGSGYVPEWSAIDNEEQLVICFWDDASSEWIIAGTSQTIDGDNDSITVNGISPTSLASLRPFSKWTIGSRTSDNPLPVELLAFTSEIISDGIRLNWSTACEINNLGFEIWRSDKNDSNYVLLSDFRSNENLVGAGNSSRLRDYYYTDRNVRDSYTYWYKIVDVDVSNQKTVHGPLEVTFIRISIATSYQLGQNYPNPFNGYTKIPIYLKSQNLSGTANGTLQIFNLLGKQVRNFNLSLITSGKNEIQWDGKDNLGNSVASGPYFYQVELNGEIQSRKLLLIR